MGLHLPPGAIDGIADLQRRLQEGDPTIGWAGEPNAWISKCDLRDKCGGWCVKYARPDGRVVALLHTSDTHINDGFLRMMADSDTRNVSASDRLDAIESNNAKLDAENAEKLAARDREYADRLAFQIRKEH